jgi:hypothetical protein
VGYLEDPKISVWRMFSTLPSTLLFLTPSQQASQTNPTTHRAASPKTSNHSFLPSGHSSRRLSWGGPGASLPSLCGGYPQGGMAEERNFCCCMKACLANVCKM